MRSLKKEGARRLQRMSIASILDERSIGGRNANLSLRELDRRLNDFQLAEARKRRKNFPCLHQPAFESRSISITNEKLNEARAKENMLSSTDSYHMAKFMNNLIERKYESMSTTQ